MKKLLLAGVCSLAGLFTSAQSVRVFNSNDQQPIHAVVISNTAKTKAVETDENGKADISSLLPTDSIVLQQIGYQSRTIATSQLRSTVTFLYLFENPIEQASILIAYNSFKTPAEVIPNQIVAINHSQIQFANQPTSAELLSSEGNVFVQKSQLGGGSPVIRGFEANKILLVVDGIRMNNAIYRGGHLQNVITLDPNAMDRAEVIFGPGTVIYGSDALGGVLSFNTLKPSFSNSSKPQWSGSVFSRYQSAYNENTNHFSLNGGTKKWAWLTMATYSDFGDLRQGNIRNPYYGDWGKRNSYVQTFNGVDSILFNQDPNTQVGSGYQQLDLMQKIAFRQNTYTTHTLNIQYSTSSEINRYDRLTETASGRPRFATWKYGPQDRLLAAYHLESTKSTMFSSTMRFTFAYQSIEESRISRSFRALNEANRIENVKVLTMNLDLQKNLGNHLLSYGAEATINRVQSTAFNRNINTNEQTALSTRYPDGGSTMNQIGVYALYRHTIIQNKLIATVGTRFSLIDLDAQFVDTTFYPFPFNSIQQSNKSLTGNAGIVYNSKKWKLGATFSSGFRAPNVDDLAKIFESVPGRVIVPNADLKPEFSYTGELSATYKPNRNSRIEGNAFYTLYKNAISTGLGTFNGKDSIDFDGRMSQVITQKNIVSGYVYGFNAGALIEINSNWLFKANVTYTYGRFNTDTTDYPMDHIPPVFGRTGIDYSKNKIRVSFWTQFNGWKRLNDYNKLGEDNLQYATALGTPAWMTLNIRGSYRLSNYLTLQAAVENILDTNYRVFASGISAPGRNLSITARVKF